MRFLKAFGLAAILATVSITPSLAEPAVRPPDASSQSTPGNIDVHGHWLITIVDPDGTVVDQREFENAHAGDGTVYLVHLLGR